MRHGAFLAVFLAFAGAVTDARAATTVSVADPAGGARWTARQSTSGSGRICVTVRHGSARKGRSCARLDGRLAFSYNVRTQSAASPRAVRTILTVAFAPDVVSARLSTPGGPRTYRRRSGRPRVLLAVLAGRVERPALRALVRRGGRTSVVEQAAPPAAVVADPLGGPAWRAVASAGEGGHACATWERVPPRYAAPPARPRGTTRCGDAGADVPVAAAQPVDGRLVVFGVGGANVRSAVLRGLPEGDRALTLEATTRALLAVLPGGTDPAALRVVVRLDDGRDVERPLDVVK
jgi:hypothetical protein